MTNWQRTKESDAAAHELFSRHYSCKKRDNRYRRFCPGEKIVLVTRRRDALFVWLWQKHGHIKDRPYCLAFRNESETLSSQLILEAERFVAAAGWDTTTPAITFVDPRQVKGDGYCFKKAGWEKQKNKTAARQLIILTKKIAPETAARKFLL